MVYEADKIIWKDNFCMSACDFINQFIGIKGECAVFCVSKTLKRNADVFRGMQLSN
ncbi:hypothetical protein [Vagococcus acidifermentans]|uniref:hypothetical protein n=1 Tax=Vagococcus acidifermentans TaxID=564710 RepID=UPI0014775968|nr:hypothetical protein [Vagococcus acidifermentans]